MLIKIETLDQLYQAAQDRKSVVMPWRGGTRLPAAWVINFQGHLLYHELKRGIYLYVKPHDLLPIRPAAASPILLR